MKNKIDLKVDYFNKNHPRFYKKKGAKWVGISKQEFNEICLEMHNL